jgi:hypothetical protein
MLDRLASLGSLKLESSGLTVEDGALLKIDFIGSEEVVKLSPSFRKLCALKINYFDEHAKPLSDWPKGAPFFRLRYLESSQNEASKNKVRYSQMPNTAPVAYYPTNFTGWSALCVDVDKPLIITEGELKAAKACKEGFPTLGLGGVWNWRANKLGVTWLSSLECVVWLRRNVYICFDSDYKTNPQVCKALKALADELSGRGSFVHIVVLPNLPGIDKVGLDDFLVRSSPCAGQRFRELLSSAEPVGLTDVLWDFNSRYVYVRNPGLIVPLDDLEYKVSPQAFKEHLESTTQYRESQIKPDGSTVYKSVSAASAWLKWPLRLEVPRITYDPGEGLFSGKDRALNVWPGWGVEPKKGSIKMWDALMDYIFAKTPPEDRRWFLQWCAYPLQFPGTKMFTSVVIHGIGQGTGKTLVGDTLGYIYGKNSSAITQKMLRSDFNAWAQSKQFVRGDEITGSNNRTYAADLKQMITQKEISINVKQVSAFYMPDRVNYMFNSQNSDSLFLEDDDRRFFVHEVVGGALSDAFFTDYFKWLGASGAAHLFHYLLNVDVKDFNPASRALKTDAKRRMICEGRSDLASWVRQLQETPDHVLQFQGVLATRDLFTSKELLHMYDPMGKTSITANGVGRELARAGIRHVYKGGPVRSPDGGQSRYYAIRRCSEWDERPLKDLCAHLVTHADVFKDEGFK